MFKAVADFVKGRHSGHRNHITNHAVTALVAQLCGFDMVTDIVFVVQMPARLFAGLDAVEGDFGGVVVDQNFVVAELVFRYFSGVLFFELLRHALFSPVNRPCGSVFVFDFQRNDGFATDADGIVFDRCLTGQRSPRRVVDLALRAVGVIEMEPTPR